MSRASPASQAPSPERRAAVGLYLAEDNGARLALLVHAREHGPFSEVILDVAGPDASRITSTWRRSGG